MSITYNGLVLTDLFTVEYHVERQLASWEPQLVDVPGRDGAIVGGSRAAATTVSMSLYAVGGTREQRQASMRTLAAALAVREPKQLVLSDEGGLWRMAMPTDEVPMSAFLNADSVQVAFVCPDPWLYGETRTATVPSGGSATIDVGGTAPTWPTITASATGGSQGTWILTTETGSGIYAAIASGATRSLSADCAKRVVTVNQTNVMLPPSYDWPELTPGEHTLTMTQGTGAATVTWVERWW